MLILTGDQGHTDHIATGQQLSRHSLPAQLCFTFLPTAQNILKFRLPKLALLVLPDTQADTQAKPKEPVLHTYVRLISLNSRLFKSLV